MRIIVLGAGHVGRAIVDALYQEHEVTVVDTDADRLQTLADRYDVRVVEGNGTTKRVIAEAGIQDCSLFIASTSREEANLVSAMMVKKLSRATRRRHHELGGNRGVPDRGRRGPPRRVR
jgi:trk system potassium uptake protein TrkA